MPRKSRIDYPGALHHIMARGIEQRNIFQDDFDRFGFLKNLGLILEETETTCYAWSLMPNHFHLLLRTGIVPVATVMRRILTGHAVRFNKRHERQGHLFQNRYKSILCQKDAYLLELVRYIHLNPLRASLVDDLSQLDIYPFCGHSIIMGNNKLHWQKNEEVLKFFSKQKESAKHNYREFLAKGINHNKRYDLTEGNLMRKDGCWYAIKQLKEPKRNNRSDERILGDDDFISEVLLKAKESFKKTYHLKSIGIGIDFVAKRAAAIAKIPLDDIWRKGRYKNLVRARDLLCFWSVRELGENMASMGRMLNISTVAVSKSVARGAEIVEREGLKLIS